jgi:hypothetical protein
MVLSAGKDRARQGFTIQKKLQQPIRQIVNFLFKHTAICDNVTRTGWSNWFWSKTRSNQHIKPLLAGTVSPGLTMLPEPAGPTGFGAKPGQINVLNHFWPVRYHLD